MKVRGRFISLILLPVLFGICCLIQLGCGSTQRNVTIGAGGATAFGSLSASSEIEQVYYLGVLDPHDQVPATVYRVRVRGQASFISRTKFASGWVHASLIDSIGSSLQYGDDDGILRIEKTGEEFGGIKTGRRLMLFGPEGFREAPKDHRLAIVMGATPQEFFNAMDRSLGVISEVQEEQHYSALNSLLFEALAQVQKEKVRLDALKYEIEKDLTVRKGV